ncbi:putative outer membrane protein [Bacteroides pyogenes DSM 20611 = JCM 6294]|uniref:Putative outer membrane protein n=1 Tax=Bacteroides pyogenes DSM 20611 = JCM 6294 TaxID=1121100 RepID=W4PK56_9BACE|nr:putative outer membrane protein [Bacteroides pyogenes DSM 20611 = JCM 6294]
MRGMLYFYLARAYGRPYYQAPDKNLGVPIVNGTPENVLGDMLLPDRATVEKTYAQAIEDLKKAESLMTIDKGVAYASKEAAWAMLSRIYLYMSGTYESPNREYAALAADYATKVIKSNKYTLLPRADFMKYNQMKPENNKESIFVVKRVASEFSGYDHYYGVGGMYANIGGMGWGEMYASAKYIDLLNETGRNDWRPDSYKIVDARAAFIEPTYYKSENGKMRKVIRFIKPTLPAKVNITLNDNIGYNYVQADFSEEGGKFYAIEKAVTQYERSLDDPDKLVAKKGADGKTEVKDVKYELDLVSEEDGYFKVKKYNAGNNVTPILIDLVGTQDYFIILNRAYPQFYITKCSREGEDSHLHSPVISRLGEIFLNRAEAYAKMGEYGKALIDLNTIRGRSIEGGEYPDLSADKAGELIDKERQLELAFQAERSYDVFRNGKSLQRRYPGPQKQFEDVPATDFRVVYYIPQDAINSYPGTLTQNPTDNSNVILH